MRWISTELSETTIQVTYTDGQPADNAKQALIVRLPRSGSLNTSANRQVFDALMQANTLIQDELERLDAEMKKR